MILFFKKLKGILGFIIAALIIVSAIAVTVCAETAALTMPDASDMIPDGTNIPDSNIKGAIESTSPLESITLPDTKNGTTPARDIMGDSGIPNAANSEAGNTLSRVLGIVIAVIVVLAVILLVVSLIPKKISESRNRNGDN